jgi:hypothetical protein
LSHAGRGEHRKTGVVDAVVRAPIGPFPRPPVAGSAERRWSEALSVAEADGNRTRLEALAPTPVLKDRNVVPYGRGAMGEAR